MTRLLFVPSADNERGPKYLEGLIAGWASMTGRTGFTLSITSKEGSTAFELEVPDSEGRLMLAQLGNAFPGSHTALLDATSKDEGKRKRYIRLSPDVLPLVQHDEFVEQHSREAVDPVEVLLESLRTGQSAPMKLSLRVRPAKQRHVNRAMRVVAFVCGQCRWPIVLRTYRRLCSGRLVSQRLYAWLLSRLIRRGRPDDKASQKLAEHLLLVELVLSGPADTRTSFLHKVNNVRSALTQFTHNDVSFFVERKPVAFLATPGEVATLWHPPVKSVEVPHINHASFRQLEPPKNLASRKGTGSVLLGRVCFRQQRQVFRLDLEARRRHVFVCGKTGMGKSTLLLNMLASDILQGHGCALIDPHGDLAEAVVCGTPKRRTNDVVLFDAGDRRFPVSYNPLACDRIQDRPLVADGVLTALKKLFGDSWGPRMEDILRNSLLALLEQPRPTLLDLNRLLNDAPFRKSAIARVSDPVVRAFWLQTFAAWNARFRSEAISPVQNKINHFLTNPILRNIVSQPDGRINLRQIMDEGKILIVNLSQGKIGESACRLLGSFLMSSLQIAAMSRADIREADRRDFFAYIDEFGSFASDSFADTLSQARKYRLSLTMACQYLEQVDEKTLPAVFGNVGSMLAFQVGARDADTIGEQFGGVIQPDHLMNMPKYHAYCRLLLPDGMPSRPFSMSTLPPDDRNTGSRLEIIRKRSRKVFGTPVKRIERNTSQAC